MALKYALLAALQEEPASGYELTQRFRTRLANVWNASHQQIYRELGKLESGEEVVVQEVAQQGKPDKRIYAVTDKGCDALVEWLETIQPRPATRDPFLVKLFAGDLTDPAVLLRELDHHRSDWLSQLGYYRAIENTYFRNPQALSNRYRLQYLALRRGVTAIEGTLRWAEELEQALREMVPGPGLEPGQP